MSRSVIRIQNAHKFYNRGRPNQIHVMDDVTLELPESGMVAIFGKSGCGKTTLLNAIGGLDKIASGSIELFGQNLRADPDTIRNRYIGYIFQNYNLQEGTTVYENVAAALRLCGMTDEQEISERVTAALRNVGMDKYVARTPDTLSGGQQQRVAIARALVKNPAIILADEPTGNLDEANTVLVMDILKEISKTHLVLLVTHEAKLVQFYCDRVIEIVDGRIHADRENAGANGYVRRNRNDIYLGELAHTETAVSGVTLHVYGDAPAEGKTLGLTLVNIGGKMYLKCDDPTVKLLDEGSEIHLREGVFTETPTEEQNGVNHNGHAIDMSRLTPVAGTGYGRLYHMKNAFTTAWRQNFSRPRKANGKKRGRGLRAALFMLAVVLAFMSSSIGAGFKTYAKMAEEHNDRLFYVPLDPELDYSALDLTSGQNAVTHARIIGSDPQDEMDYISFKTAAFMTGRQVQIDAGGFAQNVESMPSLSVVAGVGEIQSPREILITTAMADDLIESSTVGYINDYSDLVGLVAENDYRLPDHTRIVGVLESDEQFFYVDSIAFSHLIIEQYVGTNALALSETKLDTPVTDGEILFIHWVGEGEVTESPYRVGDTVAMVGRKLRVGAVLVKYYSEMASLGFDNPYAFVLSDNDFKSLAYTIESPSEDFGTFYGKWEWGMDSKPFYSNHLQIRSSDPTVTEAYLVSVLGEDGFFTPADMLEIMLASARRDALVGSVTLLIFLALLCLCVFFIMRASFMSRVREVGILRAIGVTRKNLVFRFAVETAVLLLLTTVVGYLASGLFIGSLADAPLFSEMFFFPPWLAVGMLCIILGAALFFGILPSLILLRKTPSEILAKYDI